MARVWCLVMPGLVRKQIAASEHASCCPDAAARTPSLRRFPTSQPGDATLTRLLRVCRSVLRVSCCSAGRGVHHVHRRGACLFVGTHRESWVSVWGAEGVRWRERVSVSGVSPHYCRHRVKNNKDATAGWRAVAPRPPRRTRHRERRHGGGLRCRRVVCAQTQPAVSVRLC